MTENDFPALRSAVRGSAIGHLFTQITASVTRAASNGSAARLIGLQVMDFRGTATSERVRLSAIALMTACVATWALSRWVPPYVSLAIPGAAFLVLAGVCAAAAAGADRLADHWSRSRMRRVSAWLRGA